MLNSQIFFQQLFEQVSSTYTYILMDSKTRDGLIIDPVLETLERDHKLLQELGIKLRYILDTHVHADHVTSSASLAERTGAAIAMNANAGVADIDVPLQDGQILQCGNIVIKAIATPGHTNGCMCYSVDGAVFTGDTLLIRGNGRTDFQNGSPAVLYESIMQKLFTLPDETTVYPAHDYAGLTSSTIGMEKKFNKRITAHTTQAAFIDTMQHLNLALPKKIDVAVPANLRCGRL